jgi:NADH-quinone oxidoreductase subunit E
MAKKKTKAVFVGLKLTEEQAALLARLQGTLNPATKTEVLLKGLDMMGRMYPPGSVPAPAASPQTNEIPSDIVTNLELARLEAEVRRISINVQQTKTKTKEVIRQVTEELSKTDEIVGKYKGDKSALIQVLLELQRENRWLPEDTLKWVSKKLEVPLTQIYHVATFYKAFSLVPKGRHDVSVCLGTACQVRGAPRLLDKVIETFKVKPGETSSDMRFSLDTVNCLGCCAQGPVMVVDGKYYSQPSLKEIEQIAAAQD